MSWTKTLCLSTIRRFPAKYTILHIADKFLLNGAIERRDHNYV